MDDKIKVLKQPLRSENTGLFLQTGRLPSYPIFLLCKGLKVGILEMEKEKSDKFFFRIGQLFYNTLHKREVMNYILKIIAGIKIAAFFLLEIVFEKQHFSFFPSFKTNSFFFFRLN